jgi:hypothetical protein
MRMWEKDGCMENTMECFINLENSDKDAERER